MFDVDTIALLVGAAAGMWASGFAAGKVAAWIRGMAGAV